jgi:hypothetical protein
MLWHQFLTNVARGSNKWPHYFQIYERHTAQFRGRSMVVWEIGVQNGGSLQAWKQYFGSHVTLVGIDIDPNCTRCAEAQVHIRIGNQSDTVFLQEILDEFGTPEIIIDDGSHMMKDMRESFFYLYPKLPDNSVYIIEDMHTCYWENFGGGLRSPNSFMETCKDLVDELNAYHTQGKILPNIFTNTTFSVCFYDSVVVFEKKRRPAGLCALFSGTVFDIVR